MTMPLTKASLSTKIQTEIIALYGAADDASKLKDFADAIAQAVVDEITTNAVVPAGSLTAPVGGGPVTGTTTVT